MLHLILGMQGSGKTLLLVKYAYEAYRKGKIVYSNVDLKFPYRPLDYKDIIDCNLENGIVCIDEIGILLNARKSMSARNINITEGFLSMIRKKNLDVYATTQTPRKVDIRFREESDYIYVCEKYAKINGQFVKITHNQNLSSIIPILIKVNITQSFTGLSVNTCFHANKYFKLYDTNQIIKVKGII
jgi:hypothetical protein